MLDIRFMLASLCCLACTQIPESRAGEFGMKWAASWTTAIQSTYAAPAVAQASSIPAYDPQPDLSSALPDATMSGAVDQTFRFIIKPDIWGKTVRIRLSNVFGSQPVTFESASIGLQQYQANVAHGTNVAITFRGGAPSIRVPAGEDVFSDPIHLSFVDQIGASGLAGRNLAVSLAVQGSSGPISYHADAWQTNYISPQGTGDVTLDESDTAFPFSSTAYFFLNEFDVLAPRDTIVLVAYGDSITDGTFSTLNGYDRWSNVMSRKLHEGLGDDVSVVNEGISGNAVSGIFVGQSAVDWLGRDVLSVSGVSGVVWLEGINDLGGLGTTDASVIEGYKQVVARLHANNIAVVGATVTPSYGPGGQPPANSPFLAGAPPLAIRYAGSQTDTYRKQLNAFIMNSGIYDSVADFSGAITDPATGTMRSIFVPNSEGSAGDYLHPNRYGYQIMGKTAAAAVLKLVSGKVSSN